MRESASNWGLSREGFIEVYIDNQRIFIIVLYLRPVESGYFGKTNLLDLFYRGNFFVWPELDINVLKSLKNKNIKTLRCWTWKFDFTLFQKKNLSSAWARSANQNTSMRSYSTEQYKISVFTRWNGFSV